MWLALLNGRCGCTPVHAHATADTRLSSLIRCRYLLLFLLVVSTMISLTRSVALRLLDTVRRRTLWQHAVLRATLPISLQAWRVSAACGRATPRSIPQLTVRLDPSLDVPNAKVLVELWSESHLDADEAIRIFDPTHVDVADLAIHPHEADRALVPRERAAWWPTCRRRGRAGRSSSSVRTLSAHVPSSRKQGSIANRCGSLMQRTCTDRPISSLSVSHR